MTPLITATSELKRYREQAPEDLSIGSLCWYSVSGELCLSHEQVKAGLEAVGLTAHVPRYPQDSDVFKRVSTNAQRKKVPTGTPDVFHNYMMREVSGRGDKVITRRIVIEVRSGTGKKLDYRQVRDFEFDRNTGKISVIEIGPCDDAVVDAITQEILDGYEQWRGRLNAYSIREMIRNLIVKAGGTCVREGGAVYFIPQARAEVLDALEPFANDLDNAVNVHSLPLIDDDKQRKMIRRAFEAESIDAVDAMMGAISDIRRAGEPITEARYAKMLDDYKALVARTKEYEGLLEVGLTGTHSRLGIFQQQIVQLIDMVKH